MPRSLRSPSRHALLAGVALVALAGGAFVAAPAAAAPPGQAGPSIRDPQALLEALAPELLDETLPPLGAAERAEVQRQTGAAPFELNLPAEATGPLQLAPAETEGAGLPVSITVRGARGVAHEAQGLTWFEGADDSSASYLQPVRDGVRLLTALADATAGEESSYDFGLPEGSYPTLLPTGDTLLSDAAHHYIGTLAAPWARDASGRSLPTSYSWSGSTLTQHVELDGAAFPVLLDPLWLYSYDFSTSSTGWSVNHPKASENAVSRLLHGCFNCYFPIFGAPRSYPVDGQILPLSVTPFTWTATAAPVKAQTANGGALQFLALDGHFDGAGSLITFSWYNDPSGYLHLYVHAMVRKDNGPAINLINSRTAGANWLLYWKRVADSATGSGGGGGV
ncbi:hypothetical protein SCB71_07765 [Herbiconiux sp. KACC 21604]|uniref:hypothetical protein n=1 Tax=unclassified Herbiconiux TaxID=2618217 RepID=UPI0014919B48|nr:hypothetical protein [Herbiconiux sp. SALV-R1]QJU53176.1 hypothetical protein HL652_05730 [Herbiconiux sp. SALV-R1]WPO88123.1 hypothetical protein SCB71_07765 [Herbiconiux sp. KACC 21604]